MTKTEFSLGFGVAVDAIKLEDCERGSFAADHPISARKIEEKAEGILVFGDEIPLKLRFAPRISDDGQEKYFRMEARTDDFQYRKWSLVVAALDYCLKYVDQSKFLPPRKKAQAEKLSKQETTDAFETGKFVTAGLKYPQGFVEGLPKRFRFKGWVFGICSDYTSCYEQLVMSEEIRRIERMTEARSLRFWPKGTAYAPLTAEEAYECVFLLYNIAIPQALAGPGISPASIHPDPWMEKPVATLVEMLYKQHVYNWVRKQRNEHRHLDYDRDTDDPRRPKDWKHFEVI